MGEPDDAPIEGDSAEGGERQRRMGGDLPAQEEEIATDAELIEQVEKVRCARGVRSIVKGQRYLTGSTAARQARWQPARLRQSRNRGRRMGQS